VSGPGISVRQGREDVKSGARIPKLEPSSLDDEQRSLYDAIAAGR